MRKKILIGVIVLIVILMAGINLYSTKESEKLFKAASLSVGETANPEEAIILSGEKIAKMNLETIHVNYQRKVGPAEEKTYQGIALSVLLNEAGVTEQSAAKVVITARDQYQVELTAEEAFMADNAYLVVQEGENPLTEEEGDYMLVLCKDQLSTRWVKQVVGIEWTHSNYEQ